MKRTKQPESCVGKEHMSDYPAGYQPKRKLSSSPPKGSSGVSAPRGSTCDELHKELFAKGEIVLPLRTLGELFMGALAPFANNVNAMAAEMDSLKDIVVRQNDRIKELERAARGAQLEREMHEHNERCAARKKR